MTTRKTLFVQFYSDIKIPTANNLINGFSDTFDLCKNRGEFVWVNLNNNDEYEKNELDIEEGIVYVSAAYSFQLLQTYIWTKMYPKVEFFIGGPIIYLKSYAITGEVPKNMHIMDTTIENLFGVPDFSCKWKLDIPSQIDENMPVYFSYTLNHTCYWGKCNFCSFLREGDGVTSVFKTRYRKKLNYEFTEIKRSGPLYVSIGTSTFNLRDIKRVVPTLPEIHGFYRVFIRPAKPELEALKEVMTPKVPHIHFVLGAEYPVQKMWDYIKKGYNKKDFLEFVWFLKNHPTATFNLSMNVGWDNLEENDLKELELFMNEIPGGEGTGASVMSLFASPNTEVFETYKNNRGKTIKRGPFYIGYYPIISEEQQNLNKRSIEIISSYAKQKNMTFHDITVKNKK